MQLLWGLSFGALWLYLDSMVHGHGGEKLAEGPTPQPWLPTGLEHLEAPGSAGSPHGTLGTLLPVEVSPCNLLLCAEGPHPNFHGPRSCLVSLRVTPVRAAQALSWLTPSPGQSPRDPGIQPSQAMSLLPVEASQPAGLIRVLPVITLLSLHFFPSRVWESLAPS